MPRSEKIRFPPIPSLANEMNEALTLMMNLSFQRRWLLFLAGVVLLAGCGESGPVRYQVSGKVQFQGKPVPAGSVIFTPDSSQGNSGPQGVAEIKNGVYHTSGGGLGTVGGPHTVLVIATQANVSDQDAETVGPLARHTFEIDLPKAPFEHDIDIP